MSGTRFINMLRDSGYRWAGGAPLGDTYCAACDNSAVASVALEHQCVVYEYEVCRDCYLELEAKLSRKEES